MTKRSPFRHFKTSLEIVRLAMMMYDRFPLSPRNVEDLLHEPGVDIFQVKVRVGSGEELSRRRCPLGEARWSDGLAAAGVWRNFGEF